MHIMLQNKCIYIGNYETRYFQMFVIWMSTHLITFKIWMYFQSYTNPMSYTPTYWENTYTFSTVSVSINRRRSIKNQGFELEVYWNFSKICPKKPQKGDFLGQKGGGLFEFCIGGSLIKSGGLLARIRYSWLNSSYLFALHSKFKKYLY